MESPEPLPSPASISVDSPAQAKRRLEAHLAENQKRIELTGTLGESLLRQQSKINSRILDLENYHGDELTPDLKAKLVDLEKEYNDVERTVSRTMHPLKGRDSTFSHEDQSLFGAGNLSPTKPVALSRRQRNATVARHQDIELAADIGQTLIVEVRKLQGIITEKDECIKSRTDQQTALERQLRSMENRLRAMDESEERFKDENWNLELQTQELKKQLGDATLSVTRLTADTSRFQSTIDSQTEVIETMKAREAQLMVELEEKRTRFESELVKQKSTLMTITRDRSDLQHALDQYRAQSSPTPTKKHQSLGSEIFDDQPILLAPRTPEHSPPRSPVKGTPSRNAPLEAETAKASLSHWQALSHHYKTDADVLRSENNLLKNKLDDLGTDLCRRNSKTSLPAPPSRAFNIRRRQSRPRPVSGISIAEEEVETAPSSAYGTADEFAVDDQTETEAYRTVDEEFMSDGERTETGFNDDQQRHAEQAFDELDPQFSHASEDELEPPAFRIPRTRTNFRARHRIDSRIFTGPPQSLNQELCGRRISVAFSEQGRVETFDIGIQAVSSKYEPQEQKSDVAVQCCPDLVDVGHQMSEYDTNLVPCPVDSTEPSGQRGSDPSDADVSAFHVILPIMNTDRRGSEESVTDRPATTDESCQTDLEPEIQEIEVKVEFQKVEVVKEVKSLLDNCTQTEEFPRDTIITRETHSIGVQSEYEKEPVQIATCDQTLSLRTETVGVQTDQADIRTSTIKLPMTPVRSLSESTTPNTFGGDRYLLKHHSRPPLPIFHARNLSLDGSYRSPYIERPSSATYHASTVSEGYPPNGTLMGPPARSTMTRTSAIQSLRGVKSASQFGVTEPPTLRASPRSCPRKSNRMLHTESRGRAPSLSAQSKRSSLSSFTSEVEARFGLREDPDEESLSAPTDPYVIQAITQTMIGEFLWKYTRKKGRQEISENRHKRFFWVHPYTKTLYWSDQNPAVTREDDLVAKSCAIQQVRLITDDNPFPPGLYHKSLVVITPSRALKFTAPTKTRHDMWFTALDYLLNHNTAASLPNHNLPNHTAGISATDIADFDPNIDINRVDINRVDINRKQRHGSSRFSSLLGTATFGSRRARQASIDIYENMQETESVESEHEANSLDNVRSCCNGKHDVGTLSRSRGRRVQNIDC
ncbi:Anucleate primary sterigmata protein A [Neolecta irregularis DAH-3]|uniref:Anucleate primary sterigmata protein A n=1 Tax=Neolecta irregularis (strain DAH-3) TaxID=1198029 RepID=A0A1U7LGZ8_NEOID|nr:Anucleate primary sterigmata protein A [Neolecta irregularis DAH-3]|eukprot:OLL21898.1 Anucleate primary sterigmata protein A [Neolecta irregularis DAH-3]